MTSFILWILIKIQTITLVFCRKSQLLNDKKMLKRFHISDTFERCNGTIDIAPEYIFEYGEPLPLPHGNESDLPVAAE